MAVRRIIATGVAAIGLVLVGCGGSDDGGDRGGGQEGGAVVWAVGDGADGSSRSKQLARRIARDGPDRFLYLGDVYENGTAREFRRNYEPVYGSLAGVTSPTPGNHEWARRAEGYNRYWRGQTGETQPPWYSFDLGGWEILSMNSEAPHGPGSPQLRWLRSELREPGTCRLGFWHRPRWSAGTVHGDQDDIEPLWDALRGRASIVVSGHDHNSQRFRPRDGVVQFVAGAGGHAFYPLRADRRVAFSTTGRAAALRLELEPGRARYAFVTSGGERLDSGEVGCDTG